MAGSRNYFSIESQAHKRGYTTGDVDGRLCSYAMDGRKLAEAPTPVKKIDELKPNKLKPNQLKPSVLAGYTNEYGDQTPPPSDLTTEKEREELDQDNVIREQIVDDWTSLPGVLHPTVDMQRLLRNWDAEMKPKCDLRVSNDAGRYLCEFIYYCSLAHRELSREGQGKVLFLHVPPYSDEAGMTGGVKVVIALCKAIVYEMMERGEVRREGVDWSLEMEFEDEAGNGKTGAETKEVPNVKSLEEKQEEDKVGDVVKEDNEVTEMFDSLDELGNDIASGKIKIEEILGADIDEDSDEESNEDEMSEDEKLTKTSESLHELGHDKAGGKMGEDERDMKAEGDEEDDEGKEERIRGSRSHTNRNPATRWQDMKNRRKTKKPAAAEGVEESREGEQKGKEEEKTPMTTVAERVVVDKHYLGYVMPIPRDEPFSD